MGKRLEKAKKRLAKRRKDYQETVARVNPQRARGYREPGSMKAK